MNVSIETLTGLERRLTIAIDSDTFEQQITSRLQAAAGQVKVSGEMPGIHGQTVAMCSRPVDLRRSMRQV